MTVLHVENGFWHSEIGRISCSRFLAWRIEIPVRIQPGNNECKNRRRNLDRSWLLVRSFMYISVAAVWFLTMRVQHLRSSEFKKSMLSIYRGLTVGEVNFSRGGTFPSKRTTFASSEIEKNKTAPGKQRCFVGYIVAISGIET